LGPEKHIGWEGVAMERIEGKMEDFGRWARKESKGIESS
jgi:hypothetical protein